MSFPIVFTPGGQVVGFEPTTAEVLGKTCSTKATVGVKFLSKIGSRAVIVVATVNVTINTILTTE